MAFSITTGDLLEIIVSGRHIPSGQQIINRMHGIASNMVGAGAASNHLLDAWQIRWQAQVLPLLNSQYAVSQYELRKVSGAVQLTPTPANAHPFKITYSAQDLLVGGSADVGATIAAQSPNYAAVSARKVAVDPRKYFRGSMRFGPINELDTIVEGNQLETTVRTNWQAAWSILCVYFSFPSPSASDRFDFLPAVFSGTYCAWIDPAHSLANSTSLIGSGVVHSYIGSQVSRKVPVNSF